MLDRIALIADVHGGVQFVRVPYDVEADITVAEALRMPTRDLWAVELRTALYRGMQS